MAELVRYTSAPEGHIESPGHLGVTRSAPVEMILFIWLLRVPRLVHGGASVARPFGASPVLGAVLAVPAFEGFFGKLYAAEAADPIDGAIDCPRAGNAEFGHQPTRALKAGLVTFVLPPPAVECTHHVGACDLEAL